MILARNYTPFTRTKELDEPALRESLQRFVDARIVAFLASGGSSEANSLTPDEIERLYVFGVEAYRGKLPVYANFPEVLTAREAIQQAQIAIRAGVDAVNFYGPAGIHGYKPTDPELYAFFDEVLSAIQHPVILAPNPNQGYTPKPSLIADVCHRYEQVIGVNLVGLTGDDYFLRLRDLLKRDLMINVALPGSINMFGAGATGVICSMANVVPRTVREYVDRYEAGDEAGAARTYADLQRLSRYVEGSGGIWHGPRWIKMALKVLKLPGGEGGVRPPYVLPSDPDIEQFGEGLLALGVPEIDDMARAAGLNSPSRPHLA
jgi:4-hydroxy-tetrahydrodipicolinate synthase